MIVAPRGASLIAMFLAALIVLSVAPAPAQENPDEGWDFVIAPYLWLTSLSGELTVIGAEIPIEAPFEEVVKSLDKVFMFHFEAGRGKWGLFLHPLYTSSSATGTNGASEGTGLDLVFWIVEVGGRYRFLPVRDEVWPPSLSVLLGARYWSQSLTLETNGNPDGGIEKDWIDPFVGFRAGSRLSPRFFLNLRGDVGGFDISDGSSDFSWNLGVSLGYDVSRVTSLWVGYRALYVDYDEGLTEQLYAYDMTMQGILLGVGFRF